jgi:signal transduction histidine kinase/ActR/RegA family two-component response regulator/HAMP domain-containing protein
MGTLSLKQKLLLITMVSTTVALLLSASAFLVFEYTTYRAMMVRDLSALAQITGSQSTAALTYGDKETAWETLHALNAKSGIVAAGLYSTNALFAGEYFGSEMLPRSMPSRPPVDGWSFAGGELSLCRHIELNGENIGAVYLRSDLTALYAELWRYVSISLIFLAVSLAATSLLAFRLQRVVSGPISHLAQTAQIVSTGQNYSVRAKKESNDELGGLIDRFNEMLARIEAGDDALKKANDDLEKRVTARTQDLQQQFSRISLLNQITQAVAARQDFASIVMEVLQQLEEHLPLDYGSAYLFDAGAEMLTAVARGPKSRSIAEQMRLPLIIPLADTVFRRCFKKGELIYVPDLGLDDSVLSHQVVQTGFFSGMGAPLFVEGRPFGLLVLMRRDKDGFSPAELEFIRALSAHVALAVSQAQLYQNLQKAYTDLHQTQQAAMQQERLKALGQMASGIAHDINNALSPIVGFSELIVRTEPGLGPDTKKYLGYIRTAGDDIAHIVAGLREFYRSREENESLARLNLNRLVEQVIDMTRPRWRDIPQGRGVMIQVFKELAPRLPDLAGIESEIREALTNLLINAVDALPAGGIITLRTHLLPGEPISSAVVEVRDSGVGMDEKTRKRCLEPFFSTKGGRGTGLGLAMVYGVVERHEGRIEIDSQPGKGTTMRLIFPLRKIGSSQPDEAEKTVLPGPFHVLCIDDEPAMRELLHEMLRHDGHRIEMADGGKSGLAAVELAHRRGQPFDVVITDLGMPYVDGREVVATLKKQHPETPVIMLTGWGEFMKKEDALLTQVTGILGKPPRIREIRALFTQIASNSADRDA